MGIDLPSLQAALRPILDELRQREECAGRSHKRRSYRRQATILMDDGSRRPAITRDVSLDGLGLLHMGQLELSEVDVRVATTPETSARLRVRIAWSKELKDGWFISGGPVIAGWGDLELPIDGALD